MKYGQHVEHT